MPLLIAAMEAFMDPNHGWRASSTTTNPVAPLALVNGPIVKELGIQYSTGALGGGSANRPNVAMGYVINLARRHCRRIEGPLPGDKSTLGQTANIIAMFLGENEDQNPWGPLNVELGFRRGTNTVTAFAVRTFANINLHDAKTGQDILTVIAETMIGAGGMGETIKPCTPGKHGAGHVRSGACGSACKKRGGQRKKFSNFFLKTLESLSRNMRSGTQPIPGR